MHPEVGKLVLAKLHVAIQELTFCKCTHFCILDLSCKRPRVLNHALVYPISVQEIGWTIACKSAEWCCT